MPLFGPRLRRRLIATTSGYRYEFLNDCRKAGADLESLPQCPAQAIIMQMEDGSVRIVANSVAFLADA